VPSHAVVNRISDSQNSGCRFTHRTSSLTRSVASTSKSEQGQVVGAQGGVAGLSLYAVLHELHALLTTWTGTCSICGHPVDTRTRAATRIDARLGEAYGRDRGAPGPLGGVTRAG
jgi:hypothetical protein